ncbi:MAG: thiamine-phosphate kinase [bacterium]
MNPQEEIMENMLINSWVRHFLPAPYQANKPHQSDAELIELPQDPQHYLAVTIDTVAEEISLGLYQEATTMGWVTVMASLSDLAAVGANPLGIVISTSVEPDRDTEFINKIARGMESACRMADTYILGGDTNLTSTISLTGCAIGLVPKNKVMRRYGCKSGDIVFTTGGMGIGNALAMQKITHLADSLESDYRPVARLKESQLIREYASSCMDSSDGLLATLDQLMRLNGLGFEIDYHWQQILAPKALEFCNRTRTPYWWMLGGLHGEFELVFTIPAHKKDDFLTIAQSKSIIPIQLGKVQESTEISLTLASQRKIVIDTTTIRNLLYTVGGDWQTLIQEFKNLTKKWGLQ